MTRLDQGAMFIEIHELCGSACLCHLSSGPFEACQPIKTSSNFSLPNWYFLADMRLENGMQGMSLVVN